MNKCQAIQPFCQEHKLNQKELVHQLLLPGPVHEVKAEDLLCFV